MALRDMTESELFTEIGDTYLTLVHLEQGVEQMITRISNCADRISDELIHELLRGVDSWREQLPGLVVATMRGVDQFYDSLIGHLHKSGQVSLVPMSAALAVAVRDRGCKYNTDMTATLDRTSWNGEVGFALDWFHYTIGISNLPDQRTGPNYGQDFSSHLDFYAMLNNR